ncbi:MAG TPA: hypothetical protein VKT77_01145 [Chthonomonadaceae bacterium]|nr:hypothetical protein [Chthonomonadaceae bacterium]
MIALLGVAVLVAGLGVGPARSQGPAPPRQTDGAPARPPAAPAKGQAGPAQPPVAAAQGLAVAPGLADGPVKEMQLTPRMHPEIPVRLGGVFLYDLGDATAGAVPMRAGKLSDANREWIATHCDVAALSPTDIEPDTFGRIIKVQKLFTPLLYLYATSVYEKEHRGSVASWSPNMERWTLRRRGGSEAPFPEPGGHWMDFANTDWAAYWTTRLNALTRQYSAFGVTVAELPLGNTFAGDDLDQYRTTADRAEATRTWLAAVRKDYPNLIVPSAVGFDLAAGHATPDPKTPFTAPGLVPRLWNDYFPLTDGAWCEGWVQPYWNRLPVAESLWESQMEAADRAGRLGQVFIAGAAYRNDKELEFALASYLLIVHNQGRAVFQPMPVRDGEPPDAGFSLAAMKREVSARPNYFRVPLGRGMQDRHQIPVTGGSVWRRAFEYGDVYVNSDETRTVSVGFSGDMKRLDGAIVRRLELRPHTGAILLYPYGAGAVAAPAKPKPAAPRRGKPSK